MSYLFVFAGGVLVGISVTLLAVGLCTAARRGDMVTLTHLSRGSEK